MKKALLLAPMSSVHERFNMANIDALRELGYDIHLLANFSADAHAAAYREACLREDIAVHDLPFARHSLKKNLRYVRQIKELLRKESFDIVHAHTETGGLLLRLAMRADRNAKYVYTPHGMSFYKGSSLKSQLVYRPVERFICSEMDRNIAINGEEYECLRKWNKNTARFVHGAGFDMESLEQARVDAAAKKAELGIPADRPLLLSVGELDENKNHRAILDALATMPQERRPYLLICGEGDERERLLQQAREMAYENCLFMPGYRYDMAEIFPVADLFVFPSFHEGLSFALMQAMTAGLPVVCSRIRGNVDLIEEGRGGYLIQPDDPSQMGARIRELLENPERRREFGAVNRETVRRYALPAVRQELLTLYRSLND